MYQCLHEIHSKNWLTDRQIASFWQKSACLGLEQVWCNTSALTPQSHIKDWHRVCRYNLIASTPTTTKPGDRTIVKTNIQTKCPKGSYRCIAHRSGLGQSNLGMMWEAGLSTETSMAKLKWYSSTTGKQSSLSMSHSQNASTWSKNLWTGYTDVHNNSESV